MSESQPLKDRRIEDPFRDRRSGNDRRRGFDLGYLGYFAQGGIERRKSMECRPPKNRVRTGQSSQELTLRAGELRDSEHVFLRGSVFSFDNPFNG
jgi:hypothetical protein